MTIATVQAGNFTENKAALLRVACVNKHDDNGTSMSRILSVAALIVGLFAAIAIPEFVGLCIGASLFFIGGYTFCQIYHRLRNQDLLNAEQALATKSFKEYITGKGLDPTIDTIVPVHKEYRGYVLAQAAQRVF